MTRKLFAILTLTALLAIVPLTVNAQDSTPAAGAGIESVCLITDIGRVNDGTFNQYAYEGMERAVADLSLDSTYIETTAETDYAPNINTCLSEGYDVLVTIGFKIGDATYAAAQANPDVWFIGVDQFFANALPNLVGIQYREDQAGFLVGAMAALVSKSGTIGGVYGVAIPPVIKYRNGYEQGARYINPDINPLGVYIDNFYAPDRGASAAEQMVGEGADVIFGAGGPTGSGGIKAAALKGIDVIGVDQDEYFTTFGNGETPGADHLITSAMKRVDNGVYDMIKALVDGKGFSPDSLYVLELANNGIDFAPPHDSSLSPDIVAQVTAIKQGLLDGSIETGVDPLSGNLIGVEATPPVMLTAEATTSP